MKSKSPRVRLTDYIKALYDDMGYDYQGKFPMMGRQLKKYKDDYGIDDKWAYFILKYMVEIKQLNLFNEYYNGSILNLLPYYYDEAKKYYQMAHDIKEYANNIDINDIEQVIKVNNKNVRTKRGLTFD